MSDDTRERLRAMGEQCEYCGRPGCHWSRHPAAVVEVRLDAAGKLPGWEPPVRVRTPQGLGSLVAAGTKTPESSFSLSPDGHPRPD